MSKIELTRNNTQIKRLSQQHHKNQFCFLIIYVNKLTYLVIIVLNLNILKFVALKIIFKFKILSRSSNVYIIKIEFYVKTNFYPNWDVTEKITFVYYKFKQNVINLLANKVVNEIFNKVKINNKLL